MMLALQLLPFLVVAAIAAFAVLSHCYQDSLVQRIGLSGICMGSSIHVISLVQEQTSKTESCTVLIYGLAIYGIGTIIKLHKAHKL